MAATNVGDSNENYRRAFANISGNIQYPEISQPLCHFLLIWSVMVVWWQARIQL